MIVVTTVAQLQDMLTALRHEGKTIGFVATMGALHAGHLWLVERCVAENDVCMVSIFVNPTQFNNKEDLVKYPRTLDNDSRLLGDTGATIVFAPSEEEIYPQPDTRQFDFGQLDKVMEGKHRSGHFNGVAQVVSRLFDIVKPNKAYFGEKDFQQLAIIRQMVKQLHLPVEIVPMAIVREPSGLAMSSRNERLTQEQKAEAVAISKVLTQSRSQWMDSLSVPDTIAKTVAAINAHSQLKVEYFDVVDGDSLQSIGNWSDSDYIVGCIAVFCGEVRLIDNIIYKS